MLLSNKVCVITGAASQRGIGRAIAKLFAMHGGRSVILARIMHEVRSLRTRNHGESTTCW
jgi:NAD(P)-dependent dehydrogenase (short-subunit alcohol dehydrogenase family)